MKNEDGIMTIEELAKHSEEIVDEIEKVVVGKRDKFFYFFGP